MGIHIPVIWHLKNTTPPLYFYDKPSVKPDAYFCHDNGIKWKHFPHYRSPVNFTHKGHWRDFLFSLICPGTNGWVNQRDAGDLRRHCAHYDATVIVFTRALFIYDGVNPIPSNSLFGSMLQFGRNVVHVAQPVKRAQILPANISDGAHVPNGIQNWYFEYRVWKKNTE